MRRNWGSKCQSKWCKSYLKMATASSRVSSRNLLGTQRLSQAGRALWDHKPARRDAGRRRMPAGVWAVSPNMPVLPRVIWHLYVFTCRSMGVGIESYCLERTFCHPRLSMTSLGRATRQQCNAWNSVQCAQSAGILPAFSSWVLEFSHLSSVYSSPLQSVAHAWYSPSRHRHLLVISLCHIENLTLLY